MKETFNVGDYVRFNASNGSTGKIVGLREDGPFKDDPAMYVEWVYGRSKNGELLTAQSSFYGYRKMYELVDIPKEEYDRVANGPAFGD